MGCIKNQKSFLGIRFYGSHSDEIVSVGVFRKMDTQFIVKYKCKNCGREWKSHFVSWNSLLHSGFSNEQIEEARKGVVGL
jgi:transposase-like protein